MLELAERYCNHIDASEKARQDWREDIEQTPPELIDDLRDYLMCQILKTLPAVSKQQLSEQNSVEISEVPSWRDADKAYQSHYWNCEQCKATVLINVGSKCNEGQRLHDHYLAVATLTKRIKMLHSERKPPNPHWSVHAEWRQAYQIYQAHHWKCPTCRAASRGQGARCAEGGELYAAYDLASQK